MAIPFGHNIDLKKNQLLNAGFQIETEHPANPFGGQVYYNSEDGRFYGYSSKNTPGKWVAMDADDALGSFTAQDIVSLVNASEEIINGANLEIGTAISGSVSKKTPVDDDLFVISDSADSNKSKKVKYSELKTVLKTHFDTLYNKYVHPNHSGDVTSTGDGATTIAAKAVTLAKMADLTKKTIIGNDADTDGTPKALSASDVRALINVEDGANKYIHPGSGTNPHGTTASDVNLGNLSNDKQIKGLASGTTQGYVPTWGSDGYTVQAGYEVSTDLNTVLDETAKLVTAQAAKGYADSILGANDAMVYKGLISGGDNYPAADAGHTYKVVTKGVIGGTGGPEVEIGDMLICTTDSTAAGTHASVGSHWNVIQANIDGAVTGPASAVGNNFAAFDKTSGKLIKDSGFSNASFAANVHSHIGVHTRKYSAPLAAQKTQTITHNLNTEDVTVTIRETSGTNKQVIYTDVKITGVNTIEVAFTVAPGANEYTVVVIG